MQEHHHVTVLSFGARGAYSIFAMNDKVGVLFGTK